MPDLKRITEEEMQELLRETSARDPEASLLGQLARNFCDSTIAVNENRRLRIHPLYLTLGLILIFMFCVFLYFSFIRSQRV